MKKAVRLSVLFFLAVSVLLGIFTACDNTTNPSVDSTENTLPVTLVSSNLSEYAIVTDKSNEFTYLLAKDLYNAIREVTGMALRLADESDEGINKAIVVGGFDIDYPSVNTLRSNHPTADVIVGFAENKDFVIWSLTQNGLSNAFNAFVDTFVKDKTEVAVAGNYLFTESFDNEVLYNGIELPVEWPPVTVDESDRKVAKIPYLASVSEGGTHPDSVDIDVGRQLFVDDFLISSTTLERSFYQPEAVERLSSDRFLITVIYDEEDSLFKMWTFRGDIYYQTSEDGIHWSEEHLAFNTTMAVSTASIVRNPNPSDNGKDKYILCIRYSNSAYGDTHNPDGTEKGNYDFDINGIESILYRSSNGKRFYPLTSTGPGGDMTTLFYNPFRNKWVYSIKIDDTGIGRARTYYEVDDLKSQSKFTAADPVFWLKSDTLDAPLAGIGITPQLYSFTASGYESIMLGCFRIWYGPNNNETIVSGQPKIQHLMLGYSRDGFYFDRPDRTPFIASTRDVEAWNYGFVNFSTSVCTVVGDELYFYFTANSVADPYKTYTKPHIGYTKLRRDGFASMSGTGELETVSMRYDEEKKYLFVNAKADSLIAEIVNADGNVVKGYSFEDCIAFSGDSTSTMISWKGGNDLSFLNNSNFKIRFRQENGELYAFWLSNTTDGASGGFVSGGIKE